jgi:hypothetical protein
MTNLEPLAVTSFTATAEQLRDRTGLPEAVESVLAEAPVRSRLMLGTRGGLSRVDQWIGPQWSVNQLRHADPASAAPGQLVPSVLLSAQIAATVAKVSGPMTNRQPSGSLTSSLPALFEATSSGRTSTVLFEVRSDDGVDGLVIHSDDSGPYLGVVSNRSETVELQPVRPIEAFARLMTGVDDLVEQVR